MQACRLKQMMKQSMSAHSSGNPNNPLHGVALMRIRMGIFQLNISDGFRVCRTQETDIYQGDESPFCVDIEEMRYVVNFHDEGSVTVMPHDDCVEFEYDHGVRYKLPRLDKQIADNVKTYIADIEPHISTRWAEIDVKQMRKLFTGWKQNESCCVHMDSTLQIKRRNEEVVYKQICDFGVETFAEVNPRYMAAALKSLGDVGYIGMNANHICIADSKNELPAYMHIIVTMNRRTK